MNRASTEQVLNKAYRLAYFLHQDKSIATRIVAAATLKLNVAMAVQSKRLYYVPVGRFSRGDSRRSDGIRNKALFSDLHLLQRLLYVESEPYERQKERAAQVAPPGVHAAGDPASEEDLLVYFIKHLVRITTKRNSFYVTLGVSRLLHSYSTLETMEIYNAVIGEPERVKDDYYYRSRKAVLMHEMYQRFDQLIRVCRQRRGEERFETQQGSGELRSLMRECLRLFTPWDTRCHVPHDFDPLKSVIASLTSKSSAEENEIEVNRIHAVLHPDCFARLVQAFGYNAPAERMELPRFYMNETDDQAPPRQRSAPADLNSDELSEINDMLAEQSRRRRRSSPTAVIRIMVDGVERATLNPAEESSISFSADEGAEIIEVKTTDASGELLLATHVLTPVVGVNDAVVASIRLEGGQYLSFSVARKAIDASGGGDLLVTFGYEETDPRRAVRLWWQRLNLRLAPERYVLAGSLAAICLAVVGLTVFLGYMKPRSSNTTEPQISSAGVTNPSVTPVPTEAPIPTPKADPLKKPTPKATASTPTRSQSQAKSTTVPPTEDAADDLTRSGNAIPNLKLKDVKKVYIDIRGGETSEALRTSLAQNLTSSGLVTSTTNADEADAALKIVVTQTNQGSPQIEARLVNARGTVLWPKTAARRYSGEISQVVSEISKELLSAIRQAK